ncbi:universal stress protein [Mycolicibacterium sediminis]|uniref:Universal stress protein n=1 Tax=Mycolicibacterium sediminis TaxID=1286180 RepID=A0A7I7QZT6_9MYCO|nr:universal stress protein [Mycolicibacterium sediminis]BBY31832.1 universal stress protein [Mycolicibacterium sediminis]
MNRDADAAQQVVVGIDGSDTALAAARWAGEYAASTSSALVLLHAVAGLNWHFLTEAAAPQPTEGTDDAVLGPVEAAVRAAHPDLDVRSVTVRESVGGALRDASQRARLLVVGSGTDEDILGSHVVRITHRAECPVLVWRTAVARRTGKPLPVVVGIDESEDSRRALTAAFETARALHAPLQVVHMWELAPAVGLGYSQGLMDWQLLDLLQTQQRRRMDELVAPLAKEYGTTHVTEVFQDISPAKGLRDLSREAQLIVVGSHGSGRIATSTLGSVSQNVLSRAECPVLVVR